MGKKNICCTKCKRPHMPEDSNLLVQSLNSGKTYFHWVLVFVVFVMFGTWLLPEIQKKEEASLTYYAPNIDILKKKVPAIRISSIDFVSSAMRERHVELAYQMQYICKQRTDDVVFAFQYGLKNYSRLREDHIFIECKTGNVYGNAEILSYGEEYVLCNEEYDGTLKQVKRPSSIVLRGIDIIEWEVIEEGISNPVDACIIQHAIDVLESKWV